MKVHVVSMFLACCLGLIPVSAQADTVSVLGVTSVDGDDNLAYDLTTALRGAARATSGWTVRDHEVALVSAMQLQDACADSDNMPDAACAHAMAVNLDSPARADLLVYGTMHRTGAGESLRIVVELRLYETLSDRVTSEFSEEIAVTQIMTQDERTVLAAALIERLSGSPAVDRRPLVVSRSSGFDLEYVAWPLIGLAVVSLGVEIGAWAGLDGLQHDPAFVAYRSSYGTGTGNACAQPASGSPLDSRGHSLCSQGDTLEALEWTFMAVGLASATAGIATLVMDLTGNHPSDEHAVRLTPSVSPTQARLDLSWRF